MNGIQGEHVRTLATALLSLAALAGCGLGASKGTIDFGPTDSGFTKRCPYEAFSTRLNGSDDYGILSLPHAAGIIGVSDLDVKYWPASGSTIRGDLSGFGKRTLHNDSDGDAFEATIYYHATTYNAILEWLRTNSCFQA
jgi:hypothetical protein